MDIDFIGSFSTIGGLATLTTFICSLLTNYLKIKEAWLKQVISWIIPIIISIVGYLTKLGLFINFSELVAWQGWIFTCLTGLGIGLISNGIYDISGVKNGLKSIYTFTQKIFTKQQKEAE